MYQYYYVNDDQTKNPNWNHEVHTEEHAKELKIQHKSYLGYFSGCAEAVKKAKEKYSDADGCATCCPSCHKG